MRIKQAPDFIISYRDRQVTILSYWVVRLFSNLPVYKYNKRDEFSLRSAIKGTLSHIILQTPNARFMDTADLETIVKAVLNKTKQLPRWFRQLDFKLSGGQNHPERKTTA